MPVGIGENLFMVRWMGRNVDEFYIHFTKEKRRDNTWLVAYGFLVYVTVYRVSQK